MSQLSKGTAQKVALAQGLMGPPGLLVLDEAWTGLDAGAQAVLTAAVQQQARQGGIVVLTDHGHRASTLRPDRQWLVARGTVTEGVTAEVVHGAAPTVIVLTGRGKDLSGHPGVLAATALPTGLTVTVAAPALGRPAAGALGAGWSVHEVRPGR